MTKNFNLNERETIIVSMVQNNPKMTSSEIATVINHIYDIFNVDIFALFNATNKKGANFLTIQNYNSNESNNTEVANFTVNIGINYENMLNKDSITLNDLNIETIQDVLRENVMGHNYAKYDLSKFKNPINPQLEILELLPVVLIELKQNDQKPTDRVNNNIKLNPVLWFNTNTQNLLIFGKAITKTISVTGEHKKVASAPKTVAKAIIRDTLRKDDLRTFALSNVITKITANKETVEIS